jgi:hypothetical protein
MKYLILIVWCVSSSSLSGQSSAAEFDGKTWVAPYELSIPEGWGVERFPIPISFAPEIAYKGVEDLRFTPGWAKSLSEEYWSYAFLWYIDGCHQPNPKKLSADLKNYYSGLVASMQREGLKDKQVPVLTNIKAIKKEANDVQTFRGTIQILDYMQTKPITLNCKIHLRTILNLKKTILFFELSPQAFGHKVWQSLDSLWTDFRLGSKIDSK